MHPLTQTLELVQKAQGGDADALNRLFSRYYERARRSVRARLGQRLRSQLESGDILQQAFAKAFQTFDRFEMRNEGSFLNWLAEIAVRQVHDAADRQSAVKRIPTNKQLSIHAGADDDSGPQLELAQEATRALDRLDRQESQTAVEECLDQLPPHYRDVIVLRDYDGMEWNDVAEKLGKNTDSAAREQHRRALIELAKLLRRRGLGPPSS